MNPLRVLAYAIVVLTVSLTDVRGAILYSTVGSMYTENFDSLPTDAPNNASIETLYPNGWRDDTTSVPGSHVSVPGWYLHHPLSPLTENGFNGQQRFRFGDGSSNVGSFYAYSNGPNPAANPEKSLGTLPSVELALADTGATPAMSLFIGLRLINNTGVALNKMYLSFDAEQWRDGSVATGQPEFVRFQASVNGVHVDNWWTGPEYFGNGAFVAPVSANSDAAVDGNGVGKQADVTHFFSPLGHIDWLPGAELWIRWTDPNGFGNDDGFAIDNVAVTAFPEPTAAWLATTCAFLAARRGRSSRGCRNRESSKC
jgi:hypothetical protein